MPPLRFHGSALFATAVLSLSVAVLRCSAGTVSLGQAAGYTLFAGPYINTFSSNGPTDIYGDVAVGANGKLNFASPAQIFGMSYGQQTGQRHRHRHPSVASHHHRHRQSHAKRKGRRPVHHHHRSGATNGLPVGGLSGNPLLLNGNQDDGSIMALAQSLGVHDQNLTEALIREFGNVTNMYAIHDTTGVELPWWVLGPLPGQSPGYNGEVFSSPPPPSPVPLPSTCWAGLALLAGVGVYAKLHRNGVCPIA